MGEDLEEQEEDIWIKNFSSATSFKQYEPRFNGIFPRANLPRIKCGTYLVNFDDNNCKGIQCVSLFIGKDLAI